MKKTPFDMKLPHCTFALATLLLAGACQSDPDPAQDTFPIVDVKKELSHAPDGEIRIVPANVVADFSCDEYMAENLRSEYGRATVDSINTFGGLVGLYEA
jgi:hypothetical protein